MVYRRVHRNPRNAARAIPFLLALALWLAYGAVVEKFPSLNLNAALATDAWFGDGAVASRWVAIDGDTVMAPGGGKIRVLGVDTPELHPCRCAHECEQGERARRRTQALLNEGAVSMQRSGHDWYGRTLAYVSVGGRDLGALLIREGLGRPYGGGRRLSWCS